MLAHLIRAQAKLKYPLGVVLSRLRIPPLHNYILDPHDGFKRILGTIANAKKLPFWEWVLVRTPPPPPTYIKPQGPSAATTAAGAGAGAGAMWGAPSSNHAAPGKGT